ncbi:MAG: 16S rRNA (cytosine(1402)-N(4))-methyltransferase RsmH [Bacteroidales bacterium]|nr:16S rRNA (cytosine(1402)-N(4))-methyltransferase RsmH [Bacteroidales bacterium]
MYHEPVMVKEVLDGLNIMTGGVYVDVTYGGGGHAREILERLGEGSLIAFDRDGDAMAQRLDDPRLILIHQDYRYCRNFLKLYKTLPVDGILADLGISSHQLDTPERGFSPRFDAPLDLRMNREQPLTARLVVNEYPEQRLREIFQQYGDFRNADRLAGMIVHERTRQKITTTFDLKMLLEKMAPRGAEARFWARVFQALRIEVNAELESLKELLSQTPGLIRSGGRLVVISYHSVEDRLVKNFIRSGNFDGDIRKDFYGHPIVDFIPVNKKPVIPGIHEVRRNKRARSAKLRIAERK